MGSKKRTSRFIWVLMIGILSVTCALAALTLTIRFIEDRNQVNETARKHVILVTHNAVKAIEHFLKEASHQAETIAEQLSRGALKPEGFEERLRMEILSNPDFYGSTITYRPYGFSRNQRLFSLYVYRTSDGLKQMQIENEYDYTTRKWEWYYAAMKEGSRWSPPYFDDAGKTLMVTYSALFYSPKDKDLTQEPLGVVTLDIAINGIKDILLSLDLGPGGYPALTTREGIYLYHPNMDYVRFQKTIIDMARDTENKVWRIVAEKVKRGEGGIVDYLSPTTHKKSWLVFEPVAATGWSLMDTFIKDTYDLKGEIKKRRMTLILNLALISALAGCGLLFFTGYGQRRPWIPVILMVIVFNAAIGFLWYFSLNFHIPEKDRGIEIGDRAALNRFQNRYMDHCMKNHLPEPLFVPTGILIDTLHFNSANDLATSGYVWQKYRSGKHDHLARGFIFSASDNRQIMELMRSRENGWEIICWRFSVTIRSRISYSGYPIDHGCIRIKLLYRGLNENVILVPDLSSYSLVAPTLLPELSSGIFLPGWTLEETSFELKNQKEGIRHDIIDTISRQNLPSLMLRILIERNFVNAFISNLTPLILVSLLLFTILCIAEAIDTGRFIAICVAMFIVIVFSHIDTRKAIAIQEVFYLEYFFFLFYGILFFVVLNAIKVVGPKKSRFFSYRNNMISKLLYWPLLSGALFIITLVSC